MKNIKMIIGAFALVAGAQAQAGNLWIVGSATPAGWNLDDATALVSTTENPGVYTGTLYLSAEGSFKFLTTTDFGNEEYGVNPEAEAPAGDIALAMGKNDEGYNQLSVAENGNYTITVNTTAMVASVVKSEYTATEITTCSLFMVGSATPNGWSVDQGTPMFQVAETPYIYCALNQPLKAGTFKITTAVKGGGTWNGKYWYFRDADDQSKIALDQEGDLQWEITKDANYDVKVNLLDSSIKIEEKDENSAISAVVTEDNSGVVYYNLQGIEVAAPESGLYIVRKGDKTSKIIIR